MKTSAAQGNKNEDDEEESEDNDFEEDEELLGLSFCQLGGGWPRVVALDCEMCTAEDGVSQLARISCIDGGSATIVIDEFVQPERKIVDYLTQFSGVTQQDMDDATMTMESAQDSVADLLDGVEKEEEEEEKTDSKSKSKAKKKVKSGGTEKECSKNTAPASATRLFPAFAVGHSLDFDLRSLRIIHTRIVDTSVLYRHHAGLPYRYSLKHLSFKYLGREIQQNRTTEGKKSVDSSSTTAAQGHSSVEDAEAALQLLEAHIQSSDARVVDAESMSLLKRGTIFGDFFGRTKSEIVDAVKANSAPSTSVSRGAASAMAAFASHAQSLSLSSSSSSSSSSPQTVSTTTEGVSSFASTTSSSNKVYIRPQRSILALPDMLDSNKVRAPVILGSPSWVSSLVAGVASGKPIRATSSASSSSSSSTGNEHTASVETTHKVITRIVEEARLAISGGSNNRQASVASIGPHHHPLSLTIAELEAPRKQPSTTLGAKSSSLSSRPDIIELDSAFSSLCSRLPLGTVVLVASQGSQQRFGAGVRHSKSKLSDEDLVKTAEAQVGCLFLHVCNR
jgi:hypothetical protein